jgi:hypothetical protein
MGNPYKGDRTRVTSRVPDVVFEELERRRIAAGVNMSQFLADLLAAATGHAQLVQETNQEVLKLSA